MPDENGVPAVDTPQADTPAIAVTPNRRGRRDTDVTVGAGESATEEPRPASDGKRFRTTPWRVFVLPAEGDRPEYRIEATEHTTVAAEHLDAVTAAAKASGVRLLEV